MRELQGKYTNAKIFTDSIEDYAIAQIQMLIDQPAFADSKVRVIPDVHPGKVGTIGFTATVTDKIMPNIVGIDIGCGMTMAKLKGSKLEFQKLDTVIREQIPSGRQIRKEAHRFSEDFDFGKLWCGRHINAAKASRSLGTLGGGNHFIELNKDNMGDLYVVIHTGSRHLGKEVTEYYLNAGQKHLKSEVPYELTWLDGTLMESYIHDVSIVQEFAALNRAAILDELCKGMKWRVLESISCAHNYIEAMDGTIILRKGAISAKTDERVIIPTNMRDGVILGTGKGNADWNESAPHGAGRIMKRSEVREHYTVSSFKKEMKGIYSSCIGKDTLDEAPFAYRSIDEIKSAIEDTATIDEILKPVYNFKAGGND